MDISHIMRLVGFDPTEIIESAQEFATLIKSFEARLSAIEARLDILYELLISEKDNPETKKIRQR